MEDDGTIDKVDAVDINRGLGFLSVEAADNVWGGLSTGRVLRGDRRRRGGTVCHLVGVLIILHERAI